MTCHYVETGGRHLAALHCMVVHHPGRSPTTSLEPLFFPRMTGFKWGHLHLWAPCVMGSYCLGNHAYSMSESGRISGLRGVRPWCCAFWDFWLWIFQWRLPEQAIKAWLGLPSPKRFNRGSVQGSVTVVTFYLLIALLVRIWTFNMDLRNQVFLDADLIFVCFFLKWVLK